MEERRCCLDNSQVTDILICLPVDCSTAPTSSDSPKLHQQEQTFELSLQLSTWSTTRAVTTSQTAAPWTPVLVLMLQSIQQSLPMRLHVYSVYLNWHTATPFRQTPLPPHNLHQRM